MRNTVAHTPLACENIQMIAGINTGNGPSCAMHNTNTMAVSRPGMRDAGHKESESDERGLHQRRHDDAERHTLHRLAGENHRRIAALSRESARKRAHAAGRSLASCIENARDDHREQKVPEQAAEATGDRQQPGGHGFDVRSNRFGELLRPAGGQGSAIRR